MKRFFKTFYISLIVSIFLLGNTVCYSQDSSNDTKLKVESKKKGEAPNYFVTLQGWKVEPVE